MAEKFKLRYLVSVNVSCNHSCIDSESISQPRCTEDQSIQPLPRGIDWIKKIYELATDDETLRARLGLDSSLSLRLLQVALKMLIPPAILVVPILLPVYYTASSNSATGLDKLSISNVEKDQLSRCWTTVLVAFLINMYFCYILANEFETIIRIRQGYLKRLSMSGAITSLLVTEIPPAMWNRRVLAHVFGKLNGGLTEVMLLNESDCAAKEEELDQLSNPDKDCLAPVTNNRDKLGVPTEWFKRKRSRLLLRRRRLHVKRSIDRLKSVAILRFSCLLSAHLALQIAVFPRPSRMVTHIIDESTANHQTIYRCSIARNIRNVTVAVGLACLSLFWAVPIAMTGLLSQLVYLGSLGTFLSRFSDRQLSFVQGLLPQLALSALMYCFPSIIWWSAKLFHFYNDSSLHILVQRHYFCFLYVQVFLVVSVSSSLTTMIPDILRDIQSVPTILATNLPKASDYFYSYLLMQTVTQCVMALFQLPDSIWVIFAYKWRKHALKTVKWSLVYPVLTNLLCLCNIPQSKFLLKTLAYY